MIINLIPSFSYRSISYDINFPCTLPFPDLPCPAAWSAQSNLLTAVFRLENATNIHLFDKAVGLATRIREVKLDIPRKVIQVTFIDGRNAKFAMSTDCVRMLESVADEVGALHEEEDQRSSLESSACTSTTSSTEDLHSLNKGSFPRPHKLVKHKRQRSLLFSLISSLVPRTLSLSSRPSSPSDAPTDPLPIAPATPSCTDSLSHQQVFFLPVRGATNPHRTRARAILVDVWRRHVLPALTPSVHVPPGGYVEWVLHGVVAKTHADVHGAQNGRSHAHGWKAKHGRSHSEGRNALDLGERTSAETLSRSSSLFLGHASSEDGEDRVVYPRRDQANEWGLRIPSHSPDGLDPYIFELSCAHESLTEESFGHYDDPYGDAWDDNDRFTFDVDRPDSPGMRHGNNSSAALGEAHVHFADSVNPDKYSGNSIYKEASAGDAVFCFTTPAVPSDVNEDDDSDESQPSPRTPEDSEELPLSVTPAQPTMEMQLIPATRTSSSRPRSRRPSPETSVQRTPHVPLKPQPKTPYSRPSFAAAHRPSIAAWSPKARPRTQGLTTDEFVAMRLDYLRRVYDALNLVHVRSQEEGWRIVRASTFGGPTSWTEGDADRALETKAKRRAWSSGLKIAAPYTCATYRVTSPPTFVPDSRSECFSGSRVWDGKLDHSDLPSDNYDRSSLPLRPPGLPALPPKIRGPVVPTGLSLGKPLRSSPLALYVWTAWDLEFRHGKYGELRLRHVPESLVLDKLVKPGMSCVSFPESPTRTIPVSPTRLFPVYEDSEEEDEVKIGSSVDPTAEQIHSDEIVDLPPVTVNVLEPTEDSMTATSNSEDDPFHFLPMRARTRTTSMYSPATSVSPALRPLTPPPSYQAAVSGGTAIESGQDVKFDASSILLRPISNLSATSAPSKAPKSATQYPCRPPLTSNPPYVPQSHSQSPPQHLGARRRSISLPTAFDLSFLAPLAHSPSIPEKQTEVPSSSSCVDDEKCNRDCEDLSQAYISPPPSPSGPIIMNAV